MSGHAPRSRAHRGLLFEYVLGLSLVVFGLLGMTVMQTRLLLLQQGAVENDPVIGFWMGERKYDGDDARSLSESLRVCGDGLERAVELQCWREQLAALLPPRAGPGDLALQRHRLVVGGTLRDVLVYGDRSRGGRGGSITVADAGSGKIIWRAVLSPTPGFDASTGLFGHPLLVDPVEQAVTAVDGDRDGVIDRLYAGDAGGRVWRVDLAGIAEGAPWSVDNVSGEQPSLWQVTPLFSAGRHVADMSSSALHQRGFTGSADVVQASDAQGRYDAVLIGSGGRDAWGVENWFYMIKDRGVVSGMPAPDDGLEHEHLRDLSSRCAAAELCSGDKSGLQRGWRLRLAATDERFTGHAVTAAGNVFFTSWTPLGDGCEGRRLLYAVSLRDARPVFRIDSTRQHDQTSRDIMQIVERATGAEPCHVAKASG